MAVQKRLWDGSTVSEDESIEIVDPVQLDILPHYGPEASRQVPDMWRFMTLSDPMRAARPFLYNRVFRPKPQLRR